jgi:hypothetical protein
MQALAGCADRNPSPGRAYARRQPEKMPLYQVFQRHLPAFERMWTDTESGGCLPKFVTGELQGFVRCGILAYGFAQMHCERCRKRHLVAFSCKGRGFCPSCMGRRMNEGAANLVDHFLPEHVPIEAVVAQSSARSICTPPAGLHPMTSKGGKCCAGTSCAPRWPTTVCTCWRMVTSAGAQRAFEFKRPWSDGTRSIGLAPEALISRMAGPGSC